MKILIASSSISLQGGVPAYNRELCNMLNQDHEMHILVQQDISEFEGFAKVISTPDALLPTTDECQRLIEIINRERYDIVINSNSHIISIIAPYISDDTIIIGTSHSVRYTESDTAAFNSQYIDCVIALSEYNKKYLDRTFDLGVSQKCKMVYNFVADNPEGSILRMQKKQAKKLSIVYAGGSAPTKSPELIVKIVRQLLKTDLDFTFTWIGITTPPLKKVQPFNNMGVLFPDDPRVDFKGLVGHEEAAKVIANANIFLAPSRREGCPISLLEAMRIGTIPIVSDYDIANKEIIKDGINGFIVSHTKVSSFVSRIMDIIKNHNDYSMIYDESYKTFRQELCYDVWKMKMDEIINSSQKKHIARLPAFNSEKYDNDIKRFLHMHKSNLRHMMIHENIPSALSCLLLYLSYHKH